MSTYLNQAGAADYQIPSLIGEKNPLSHQKTMPNWSFKKRTKLPWYPGRDVDFQGSSSPPATSYKPKSDNQTFINQKFSVGKEGRFQLPLSITTIQKQVPVQYLSKEPNHDYKINKVGIGYGEKSDFMGLKPKLALPAPNQYDSHIKSSLSYLSQKKNPTSANGFYNKYDK